MIVHRVVAVVDDDPRTLRTKGDNNQNSMVGTDYPITNEEYTKSEGVPEFFLDKEKESEENKE